MKKDFLRQLAVCAFLDRLFTIVTPIFAACVALAAIYAVFYRG